MNAKRWIVYSNEHGGWWGFSNFGYTENIAQAQRYTYEEASEICEWHGPVRVPPNEIKVLAPEARGWQFPENHVAAGVGHG